MTTEDLPTILIFGGNNSHNQKWVDLIGQFLSVHSLGHYYNHWNIENGEIDLDQELSRINSSKKTKYYGIIAKSAGTILALQAISRGILSPQFCLFIGLPVSWAEKRNINLNLLLKQHLIATVFLQNSDDPQGSAFEVQKLVSIVPGKTLFLSLKENTHNYDYFDLFNIIIKNYSTLLNLE